MKKTGATRGKNNGHYNTVTVPCAGCKNPVSKPASLVFRRNNRVYCSDCIPLTRRGHPGFYVGYPKEFNDALRRKVRERDKQTCRLCGRHRTQTGTLHVHHIDEDKHNNSLLNLISLCNRCHGRMRYAASRWRDQLQQIQQNVG